jgi:outer membrane lipoprotein-sorting protein
MKSTEKIERLIRRFCVGRKAQVKTTPQLDEKILADALPARNKLKKDQSAAVQPNIWRIIMRSRIIQYAVAAVIILVIITGIVELGKPIGASAVFAAAMDNVKKARTFSCMEIFQAGYQDGDKEGKYLLKQKCMFKEPDKERHESLTSPWPRYIGETTIMDYGKRQQLVLRPAEKTATLHDMSADYEIDDETGELKLRQLSTSLRDRLLERSAGAVEDHGSVELEGRTVRMLQSHKDTRTTTVWIDPKTSLPLQIELKWTDNSYEPVMYSTIQIDTELDDDLFSLEPPEGYTHKVEKSSWPDDKAKIGAKIMRLGLWCWVYAGNNDDQFPDDLADIVRAGVITESVLNKVLAAPDNPDGPPVFRYSKPSTDAKDRSNEVMLYEIYDQWPQDRVVACFADGHSELIPVQTLVQLLKPWPEYKKKLSVKMTHLHWLCEKYAKKNEGQYPGELEDLVGEEFSDETIKRLQAAPDKSEGSVVVRYHPPRADAEQSTEVILFEIYDQWPNDGAVVCFVDGHCEVITNQNRFEELTK